MALQDMSAGILDGPNGFEPQRQNNGMIYVHIPGLDDQVLQLSVKTFDLPKEQNNVIQVAHLNESRNFPGRTTYGPINCTFYDYIDLDTAGFIKAWRKKVYNPANGKIGWKRSFAGQGHIDLTGPNGQYTRTYNLIGVWPSEYDPGGQIDQQGEDSMLISLSLIIDKAIPAPTQPTQDYSTN